MIFSSVKARDSYFLNNLFHYSFKRLGFWKANKSRNIQTALYHASDPCASFWWNSKVQLTEVLLSASL